MARLRAARVASAASPLPHPLPEPAAPAAPPPTAALGFDTWIGLIAKFVAPFTVITALLFYFGYTSSRTYFAYFGLDVDVLGFSANQFAMRSPGALFVPIMVLLLLAAVLIVLHGVLRRFLDRATTIAQRRVTRSFAWSGAVLLLAGLVLAFLSPVIGGWDLYPAVTPFVLAVGAGLAGYAAATTRRLHPADHGRSVTVLLVAVLVAGTFWTAATVAEWWGRGEARSLAADLSTLPAVVLDTGERLAPGNAAVSVQVLEAPEGAKFHFRYFGLRLLVVGGDHLFLVPDEWSANASTIVVPYDDSVRLRFRFFPDEDPPT